MIRLDEFKLLKLNIDWRPPQQKKSVKVEQMTCDFDYEIATHSKNALRYRMILNVRVREIGKEQKDVGYLIEAKLAGFFSFPKDTEIKQRELMARVNGLNLLYGTFRGVLSGVTGNFPGSQLVLPTIDARAVVMDIEKRKAVQRPENVAATPPSATIDVVPASN